MTLDQDFLIEPNSFGGPRVKKLPEPHRVRLSQQLTRILDRWSVGFGGELPEFLASEFDHILFGGYVGLTPSTASACLFSLKLIWACSSTVKGWACSVIT